jgi:hypothetical protein
MLEATLITVLVVLGFVGLAAKRTDHRQAVGRPGWEPDGNGKVSRAEGRIIAVRQLEIMQQAMPGQMPADEAAEFRAEHVPASKEYKARHRSG